MKKLLLALFCGILLQPTIAATYVSKLSKIVEVPPLKVRVTVSGGAICTEPDIKGRYSGLIERGQKVVLKCEYLDGGYDHQEYKGWCDWRCWMRGEISNEERGAVASEDTEGERGASPIEVTYVVEKDDPPRYVNLHAAASVTARGTKIVKRNGVKTLESLYKSLDFYLTYSVEKKLTIDPNEVSVDKDTPSAVKPTVEEFVTNAPTEAGKWCWEIPKAVVKAVNGGKADEDSVCLLQVGKDFGNVLAAGETGTAVARILRRDKSGRDTVDEALSRKVRIIGDDYLQAEKVSGIAVPVTAQVSVSSDAKTVPDKAVVTFGLYGEDGSRFVCFMHFTTAKPRVLFAQTDMNLPAGYRETVRLPFALEGVPADAEITAAVEDGGKGLYTVEVEYDKEEGLHYAVIRDTQKTAKGEAGASEYHPLRIRAKKGDAVAEGELMIYRFTTGLRLDLDAIECYPGAKNEPTFLTLFDVDPASGEIRALAPNFAGGEAKKDEANPVIVDWRMTAEDKDRQNLVDHLGIVLKTASDRHNYGSGGRVVVFDPRAFVIPPNRIKATVVVTVAYLGETYELKQPVLLRSQPRREEVTKETEEEDMRIMAGLHGIRSQIYRNGWYSHLFPLVRVIDMLEEGYDPRYGYDPASVDAVREQFRRFINGETLGANATAEQVTFADEIAIFMKSFVETTDETQKYVNSIPGIIARLALGYFTGGASEVVFQGYDFVCNSVEMADKALSYAKSENANATGVLKIGATIAGREAFWEGVGKLGKEGLAKAKNAGFTAANMRKAGAEMLENTGFFAGKGGQRVLAAVRGGAAANAKALKAAVESTPKIDPSGLGDAEREMVKAFENGQAMARENLENLKAAIWNYKMNKTAVNKRLFNDLVLKCQSDKAAMYMMQNYADESMDALRREFNATMAGFHARSIKTTEKELLEFARKNGIKTKAVFVENATGNSAKDIANGKKVPIDRDTTFYYFDEYGEKQYFNEKLTTEIYNRNLYKETRGFDCTDQKFADRDARRLDSTVIEDVLENPESYGRDLGKMTQAEYQKLKLSDPKKVRETVRYKMNEWFEEGDRLMKEGFGVKDALEREEMLKLANDKFREGYRQGSKMFSKCLDPRDMLRAAENGGTKITEKMRKAVKIAELAADPVHPKNYIEIEAALRKEGMTRASFTEAMADLVTAIQ